MMFSVSESTNMETNHFKIFNNQLAILVFMIWILDLFELLNNFSFSGDILVN